MNALRRLFRGENDYDFVRSWRYGLAASGAHRGRHASRKTPAGDLPTPRPASKVPAMTPVLSPALAHLREATATLHREAERHVRILDADATDLFVSTSADARMRVGMELREIPGSRLDEGRTIFGRFRAERSDDPCPQFAIGDQRPNSDQPPLGAQGDARQLAAAWSGDDLPGHLGPSMRLRQQATRAAPGQGVPLIAKDHQVVRRADRQILQRNHHRPTIKDA